MRIAFSLLLVLHAFIHVLGFVKAFDLAPIAQLEGPGVVGTPQVQGFRARMTGRIRGSATAPWMPFSVEQHNYYDPPRRYFHMQATRAGLPVDGLHAYGLPTNRPGPQDGKGEASMRIRLLAEDGKTMLPQRWSTPIGNYQAMGPYRLATRGEGRYAAPKGEYAYLELEVHEVSTQLVPRAAHQR